MSKQTDDAKNVNTNIDVNSSKSKPFIPEKYHDLLFIGGLILSIIIFFWSGIFGGSLVSEDQLASKAFEKVYETAKETGEYPLWLPHIFGGMPGYSAFVLNADRVWDFTGMAYFKTTHYIGVLLGNDSGRVISYYFFLAIGMYWLLKLKLGNRYIAFISAFATVFSTGILVWAMIGHNTKPIAISMLPFAFVFLEKLREKFSLTYFALLAIAMHILFGSNHPQMIFYSGLALGLYLVYELVVRIITKDKPLGIVRSGLLLAFAAALAFSMTADKYLSVMDYTKYSTRGSAPIMQNSQGEQEDGGNNYDYATMWSFSPSEVVDFFVPNFHGFGQLKYKNDAYGDKEMVIPTYWGQKPFEDVAPYMGIFILFFAIFGFITNKKDKFVQFLAFLSIFALFLSFGNTMPLLYDFFYNNIPMFDKFRAPSMVLVLLQIAIPILAGYGLLAMMKWREVSDKIDIKRMKWFVISSIGFFGLGLIFMVIFKDSYYSSLTNSANGNFQQIASNLPDLKDFVWKSMISDWLINGIILIIAIMLINLFIKNKLSKNTLYVTLFLLLIFDLWRVGYRRYEEHPQVVTADLFAQTDYYDFIKQDNSLYRVFDATTEKPNSSAYYGFQSISGYSAAKMRLWQDLSDVAGQGNTSVIQNPFVWNLFNVKYIIYPQNIGMQPAFISSNQQVFVYEMPDRMPRAVFVPKYEKSVAKSILQRIKAGDFKPREIAFVEENIGSIDTLTGTEKVKITDYRNHYIKFETENSGKNLLVISEMYYPNWKAYINGKEVATYKTNFAFRSVIVPAGKNSIEMKYVDNSFLKGKKLSFATNILVVLLLLGGLFIDCRRCRKGQCETKES